MTPEQIKAVARLWDATDSVTGEFDDLDEDELREARNEMYDAFPDDHPVKKLAS